MFEQVARSLEALHELLTNACCTATTASPPMTGSHLRHWVEIESPGVLSLARVRVAGGERRSGVALLGGHRDHAHIGYSPAPGQVSLLPPISLWSAKPPLQTATFKGAPRSLRAAPTCPIHKTRVLELGPESRAVIRSNQTPGTTSGSETP
jgi:hypothetical protein